MGRYRLHGGLIVPRHDQEIARRFIGIEVAEKALPNFCQNWRVCVQAGGNWGLWPLRLADKFETVYTFEPDDTCFVALANNTRHKPNVVRIQAALGCYRRLVGLACEADTTGNQHINGPGIYPTFEIDQLGLPVCDLIYLDIEGQEWDAVIGATATIERCRPVVVFESSKKWPNDQVLKLLEERNGYQRSGLIGRDIVMTPC